MRSLSLVALLVGACAGDDVHALETCDPAWGVDRCERACSAVPVQDGPRCLLTSCASGEGRACSPNLPCIGTFEYEGTRGCCRMSGAPVIQFYECE